MMYKNSDKDDEGSFSKNQTNKHVRTYHTGSWISCASTQIYAIQTRIHTDEAGPDMDGARQS